MAYQQAWVIYYYYHFLLLLPFPICYRANNVLNFRSNSLHIVACSRLRLIYPRIIEAVKDWADCEQLTPIKVGQFFCKKN